ncbi:MAG: cytochrome P450 [Anaerolineales bacterium]|nr:cytochrome P450 [Anaerolineales bacterium]
MNSQLPPGPESKGLWGDLNEFAPNPPAYLLKLAKTYGSIARFRILNRSMYLLTDPDMIREVLVKQQEIFAKTPFDKDVLGRFLGKGLVTNDGEFHKQQRRLVQPAFHMKRIQAYAEIMVQYTDRMLNGWQDGEVRRLDEEMMALTMFIVSKTLFDADAETMEMQVQAVGEAMDVVQRSSNADYRRGFPVPSWLPTRNNRERKRAAKVLAEVLGGIIAERRREGTAVDHGDLLSMLLLAQGEDGSQMSDQQVLDEAVTLFAAGHETTSNALTWTWYLLSQHPEVEAQLHEELDGVLNGRLPTFHDLPNLPYTGMVIKEALRLYPPAWVLNGRSPLTDTEVGGYPIKKGSIVFISPYVMHRLPHYFAEPEEFRPERFTPEQEKELPRYVYLPFGAGPRVCIGNAFAMMEAQLLLATIAQRFRFELVPEQEIVPNPLITLSPRDGLQMRLVAREKLAEKTVSHMVNMAYVPAD